MTAQIVFLPFRTEQAGNFKNYAKIIIFRVPVKKLNGQRKGARRAVPGFYGIDDLKAIMPPGTPAC
jgi:hypothetical protein